MRKQGPMKNLRLAGIAMTVGLLIGLPVGYHFNNVASLGERVLAQRAVDAEYSTFSSMQYKQADGQHAREALLGFVNFSKQSDDLPDGHLDRTLLNDVGVSYVRLAKLEAQAGNVELSQQYVPHAQESFKAAGREYSRDDLMRRASGLQTAGPLARCPSPVPCAGPVLHEQPSCFYARPHPLRIGNSLELENLQ